MKEEFTCVLEELGLTMSAEKTHITHLNDGYEFLGFHIQRLPRLSASQQKAIYVSPMQRNIERYKDKIRSMLKDTQGDPVNKIRAVNRVVRGWANYYQHVQSSRARYRLDRFTFVAIWNWLYRKHGGNVGHKELYRRFILRNPKGRKVVGYGTVHLARMSDVPYSRFYLPKGGLKNPYLMGKCPQAPDIYDDGPMPDETWDGTSTQQGFALLRQDLLMQCGPICHQCNRRVPPSQLHGHHVIAQKDGGQHKHSNLRLLCDTCHPRTGNYGSKTPEM